MDMKTRTDMKIKKDYGYRQNEKKDYGYEDKKRYEDDKKDYGYEEKKDYSDNQMKRRLWI